MREPPHYSILLTCLPVPGILKAALELQAGDLFAAREDIEVRKKRYSQLMNDLKVSKGMFNSVANEVPDVIYLLDIEGKIIYINDAVKEYGWSPEEMTGRNIMEFVYHEDRKKAVYRINERRTGDRKTRSLEVRFLNKSNVLINLELKSRAVKDHSIFRIIAEGLYGSTVPKAKSFAGTIGIARDITERLKKEKAVKEKMESSKKMLKAFSAQMLAIREEEKKKLSLDLHDTTGAMTISLSSALHITELEIKEKEYESALRSIREVRNYLKNAMGSLRRMAHELSPYNLEIVGLSAALAELFSDFENSTNIKVEYTHGRIEKKIDYSIAIVLYRITQEALINIGLHAEAKKVRVKVYIRNKRLLLSIWDDGKGMDVEKILGRNGIGKMGIRGMKERTESINGEFNIRSGKGGHTEIFIEIPIGGAPEG